MKKFTLILTITLALAFVPALALAHCGNCAADHKAGAGQKQASTHQGHTSTDKGDKAHDDAGMHKGMEGHDHSGMAANGSLLDIGKMSAKGIKGTAQLKDVGAAMAKMGMKTTHHFMISFIDEKTGKPIDAGTVALKINDPDGVATGPMALMGMQGHFGVDVILAKQGEYHFILGTKLADGETRQFHYHTVIK